MLIKPSTMVTITKFRKLMLRKEITNMYKFLLTDASYAVLTVVAFIVLIMGGRSLDPKR